MDSSNVQELFRPFDPLSHDAEERYDTVVRRVNRVRARKTRFRRELARLEAQFLDNDLRVTTGPRRGEPLSRAGRRKRLARLVEVASELRQLREEERFAVSTLDRMNEALERWARETYGP